MRRAIVVCVCFFLAVSVPVRADDGDELNIKIALFGPGDELYSWWGHIALIIEDTRTGKNVSYDFGMFDFAANNFFKNFAFGRLLYFCGSSQAERNISRYIDLDRDVTLYTLDISPEKKEEVRQFAETSILPENRNYLYHHFKDSCSTRIRDIVNIATGGQFKERFANEKDRLTLREHVRRHTWFAPPADWVLSFLMGQDIDRPITIWESMFLPSALAAGIDDFSYSDSDGVPHRLVSDVEIVYRAYGRFPVLETPRKQWPQYLVSGIILACIFCLLFFLQTRYPFFGQITVGITYSVFGLLFGGLGLLLFFMSFFTSHDYTFHNANLLFCNPLLLAAFPLGIKYASAANYDKRVSAELPLRLIWLLVVLGIFASMLIKLLPAFYQQNFPYQIFMLPIALSLSLEPFGLKRLIQRIFWRLF